MTARLLHLDTPEPIAITLRRSAQARRLSLRVSRLDGQVTLTLPARASLDEALAFARSRAEWICRARHDMGVAGGPAQARPPGFGDTIPFEGAPLQLLPGPGRSPRLGPGQLILPADPSRLAARLAAFLRHAARDRLVAASDRHAAALGLRYQRISLRDTRSRWGSCTVDGALMYSWRLILAPPAVLDYVAAHEVAHLAQMNHSPAFWALVARLCPDYAHHRAWLRQEGASLHRLQLGPAAPKA